MYQVAHPETGFVGTSYLRMTTLYWIPAPIVFGVCLFRWNDVMLLYSITIFVGTNFEIKT